MSKDILRNRTRTFALQVVELVESLPRGMVCYELGRQLLRSGTSVGANYRAACRARSTAEFLAKLGIVEEEADETGYWLDLLGTRNLISPGTCQDLSREADEIFAMVVASINTARKKS